ncbi:MAG: DNA mismatch repair protein MutL [Candidatus Reconcilbacillus cellulovorans]|uniref:DNA mismatch repair protein MutL n=1 Tax=Candidatus Reconcilbacillus cellulovorans TaxID=1906605 RepID=A0A2A6E3L0_9BACL|nr:MAG: DNA mismatch repair protein MutL [Candidatus Reconcilbacillus cellulovorans]
MGKIRVLDERIANQIAAGEVVERPASVVKELIENAIDAGATNVDVAVEEGGLRLIRVRDDGVGIEPDDLELAFQRHATSKIADGKDLFRIATLGFRGEALPSIASVAKVECVSSHTRDGLGRKIVIEGGVVRERGEAPSDRGTTVTVRDLFFNTPARLKYMKSVQTELGHVADVVYRLALAHPEIAFALKHGENVLLRTIGNGDALETIAAVYGPFVAKVMMPVRAESLDYRLEGFVAKPEASRANRSGITVVVNGRYIRGPIVVQALLEAYQGYLTVGRYPVALLRIEVDPSLVDVNVHPAKLEVRFSKEAELAELVRSAVRESLGRTPLIAAPLRGTPTTPRSGTTGFSPNERMLVQERFDLYRVESAATAFGRRAAPAKVGKAVAETVPRGGQSPAGKREVRNAEILFRPADDAEETPNGGLPEFPPLVPVGQALGTYLIAQDESGLYLIDQHAAHERIRYEEYLELFSRPEREAVQPLAVPIPLEFTAAEAETLRDRLELFRAIGVELEPFGSSAFLVRACPQWFPKGAEREIVDEMARFILEERRPTTPADWRRKAAALCACKSSVRANEPLSVREMEGLLDRLRRCREPYTCPHGRPIVVRFSIRDLEKMFKR